MSTRIEPEPSDAEREAIIAALAAPGAAQERELGEWARAALREGLESDEPDA